MTFTSNKEWCYTSGTFRVTVAAEQGLLKIRLQFFCFGF